MAISLLPLCWVKHLFLADRTVSLLSLMTYWHLSHDKVIEGRKQRNTYLQSPAQCFSPKSSTSIVASYLSYEPIKLKLPLTEGAS